MNHSFNIEIASKYGINEAIFLENFYFWIKKNEANEKHFHDDHHWTYNSVKAFANLFPYLSEKQIRRTLESLQEQGLLIKGNFNKVAYDRTLWYALTSKAFALFDKSICPERQIEMPDKSNRNAHKGKPIPDINTDIKHNINTDKEPKGSEASKDAILFLSEWKKEVLSVANESRNPTYAANKKSIDTILKYLKTISKENNIPMDECIIKWCYNAPRAYIKQYENGKGDFRAKLVTHARHSETVWDWKKESTITKNPNLTWG